MGEYVPLRRLRREQPFPTHYALANPRYGRRRQIELYYSTVVDGKDGSYIFVRTYIVHW